MPEKITATAARYIKLGEKGKWEEMCFKDGTIRLGFHEAPHTAAQKRDGKEIAKAFLNKGFTQTVATNFARQVLDFYDPDPDLLWITFSNGCLYWCKAAPEIEYKGGTVEVAPNGSRLRKTQNGWHNTDVNGKELSMNSLSGNLTKVAAYRSTTCEIKGTVYDYLVRRINGENLPEVDAAVKAHSCLQETLEEVIRLLTWKDFELFVELIFSRSGWQRTSVAGGTQKTIDLEFFQPLTNEIAVAQVKSETDQRQLDEYLESMDRISSSRSFYIYHTTKTALDVRDHEISLMGTSALAESAIRSGLTEWLISKVG